MIDRDYIERLLRRYETRADVAARNYQETGEQAHYRKSYEAEMIADALRYLLSHDAENAERLAFRSQIMIWASRAECGEYKDNDKLANAVLAYAKAMKLLEDKGRIEELKEKRDDDD